MASAEPQDESQAMLMARCECGFEVRGTEDEVVAGIQEHAVKAHNMKATREQVLARAVRA
jgi:predicted small metal-binding protein